jgi:hypothetical protein
MQASSEMGRLRKKPAGTVAPPSTNIERKEKNND